jgi:hypothetical protein
MYRSHFLIKVISGPLKLMPHASLPAIEPLFRLQMGEPVCEDHGKPQGKQKQCVYGKSDDWRIDCRQNHIGHFLSPVNFLTPFRDVLSFARVP